MANTLKTNTFKKGLTENESGEVEPIYGESAETIGDENLSGNSDKHSRSNHVHKHGNHGGGSRHAVATQSVNGFMSNPDKQKLDKIQHAFIKYEMTSTFYHYGTGFSPVNAWGQDLGSLPGTYFTKVNNEQFRVNSRMYVNIYSQIEIYADARNVPAVIRVVINRGKAGEYQLKGAYNETLVRDKETESSTLMINAKNVLLNQNDTVSIVLSCRKNNYVETIIDPNAGVLTIELERLA